MAPGILRVTKSFSFDLAHALYNHDGPCKNIHGHTYTLSITIAGQVLNNPGDPKDGMVMDFTELKKTVNDNIISRYDHSLVLNEYSHESKTLEASQYGGKLILMPVQPTCENILLDIVGTLERLMPSGLKLVRVKLKETPTSYAEWLG